MDWLTSSKNRPLILFTIAAFAMRFILLIQYASQNPFYVHPIVDSALYLNWADAINSGKMFFQQEYHHPAGYAFFLALVLRATGENLFAVLLLQIIMMTILGVLIFRAAEEMLGRISAWISYVLFTLCGPVAFYSMKILSEPLYMLLLFSSFYCVWKYAKDHNLVYLFSGGVLLGAAAEVRGNALICLIPALAMIWRQRENWIKHLAAFVIGLVVFILPVLLRNVIEANVWSPVSANWGETFYCANNPFATGSFSSIPGFSTSIEGQITSVQTEANRLSKKNLTSIEAQRFWFGQGLQYIRRHPADWMRLEIRKFLKIFSYEEASSIYYFGLETEYFQPALKLLFVNQFWIVALFFIGLAGLPNSVDARLLIGYVIVQVLLLLVFWPELRFLLPIYPFAFVIIGGVANIGREVLLKKGRIAVCAMGIVVWLVSNLLLVQPIRGQEAWFANAASAYYAAGRNHEAERMAREAIKINQNYADAWVNLGAALYAQNRPDEAKEAWTNALKFAPDHLMALRNLALAVEQEDPQQALRLWQRALTAARAQHASPQTISAITAQIHRLQ